MSKAGLQKSRLQVCGGILPSLLLVCLAAAGVFQVACSGGGSKEPRAVVPGPSRKVVDAELNPIAPTDPQAQKRQARCAPHSRSGSFRVMKPSQGQSGAKLDVRPVIAKLETSCLSCHAPRVALGGFRFVTSYDKQEVTIEGKEVEVPGLADAGEAIAAALVGGRMPPEPGDRASEFVALGQDIQRWVEAGKPDWRSQGPSGGHSSVWGLSDPEAMTSLGDCLPAQLGGDPTTDERFAAMESLPGLLSETDLFSMDDDKLAQKGTVAYAVAHPLRNDFARKLRHVHLPASRAADGSLTMAQVTLADDAALRPHEYRIPENTRFYKTFFAQRRDAAGLVVYRPVETRLIVVRYGSPSLFGTYVWNAEQTEARLLDAPYRDGTPWKDLVLTEPFDETRQGSLRKYVVPARHRCVQCHDGTASKSFVLGFAPYQIHFDGTDWGGSSDSKAPESLSQVDRFGKLGLLSPEAAKYKPSLWQLERQPGRDGSHREEVWDFTLKAQSFFLGNCAHCHNVNGYAYTEGKIRFDLRAGKAIVFPTHLQATRFSNEGLRIVPASGDLDNSYLFRRFAGLESELRGQERMPLHTPGVPDCEAVSAVGRWIRSHNSDVSRESLLKADFKKPCGDENDFERPDPKWFEEDPTENEKNYVPKRADWNDTERGMSAAYRELFVTPELQNLASRSYATGWWLDVDGACKFPAVPNVEDELRKWDAAGQAWVRAGVESPRVPKSLGQLYVTTPGAHFFGQTCVKCHGRLGRGDGVIARDFREIQPANFVSGMFGQKGVNLKTFDVVTATGIPMNLAPQYFVWMASEGTRLREVPPAAQDIVGRYGGKMLGQIRDNCIRLVTGEKASARDFLLYKEVCTSSNWGLDDPRLSLDADGKIRDEAAVAAWADRGAINAGFLIYDYVANSLARGQFKPSPGECSLVPEFERE